MAISRSTEQNWRKLDVDPSDKLCSRANKTRSQNTFIPRERGLSKAAETFIRSLRARVKADALHSTLASLCAFFLRHKLSKTDARLRRFLNEYPAAASVCPSADLRNALAFIDEPDFLGTVYQSLLSEGKKNAGGSYYTQPERAQSMVSDLLDSNEPNRKPLFLDPCCGSGIFLLAARKSGFRVIGVDIDRTAVMIAKTNLLLAEAAEKVSVTAFAGIPEAESEIGSESKVEPAYPLVFEMNFLDAKTRAFLRRFGPFDASASNPPWGADLRAEYGDSASDFFAHTFALLKDNGKIHFLLPFSLLSVRKHLPFRTFLLEQGKCCGIQRFGASFSGVQTGFCAVLMQKTPEDAAHVRFIDEHGRLLTVPHDAFSLTEQKSLHPYSAFDLDVIGRCFAKGAQTLKDSTWALGIVTGNNRRLLQKAPFAGSEPVYTGKEVRPYTLKAAQCHIVFEPQNFQQCAPEAVLKAAPKLIYKFIGANLSFAPDETGVLVLNSANVLIPKVKGLSFYSVLGLLNSRLFNFLHRALFRELKVLRGNLSQLPLPALSAEEDRALDALVRRVVVGQADPREVDRFVFDYYGFSAEERAQIETRLAELR